MKFLRKLFTITPPLSEKASREDIEWYIKMVFVNSNLDWNGYMALMAHKQKCLAAGKIIYLA